MNLSTQKLSKSDREGSGASLKSSLSGATCISQSQFSINKRPFPEWDAAGFVPRVVKGLMWMVVEPQASTLSPVAMGFHWLHSRRGSILLFGQRKILCPWDFPGKSTGVGCHFLLQGTFPTQGSNLGLPHCRQMLLPSQPQREHAINQGKIWTKKWWLEGNREGQKCPLTLNKFMSWRSNWGEMHFQQRDEVFQCNSVLFIAFGNTEGGRLGK